MDESVGRAAGLMETVGEFIVPPLSGFQKETDLVLLMGKVACVKLSTGGAILASPTDPVRLG